SRASEAVGRQRDTASIVPENGAYIQIVDAIVVGRQPHGLSPVVDLERKASRIAVQNAQVLDVALLPENRVLSIAAVAGHPDDLIPIIDSQGRGVVPAGQQGKRLHTAASCP